MVLSRKVPDYKRLGRAAPWNSARGCGPWRPPLHWPPQLLRTVAINEPKYPIEAPDFHCRQCTREIPCEASYFSAVFHGSEVFERRNFCEDCWRCPVTGSPVPGDPSPSPPSAGAFAFWRSRRPPVPTDKPRRLHFEPQIVFEFFRRLEEAPAAPVASATAVVAEMPLRGEAEELRFVLALLLLRKKALSFLSSVGRDGSEWLKFSEKDTGRQHLVRNPELNDHQLERVKHRLGDLLQMKI